MTITATHITYYHLCHRKLWLFAHGLQMEHSSQLVQEGKWIGEHTYPQRAKRYRELAFEGIKIDHYDVQNKVVREVKKSNKCEYAHIAQVKYYLYILAQNGIEATGLLEYPKIRQTEKVLLVSEDKKAIRQWLAAILMIVEQEECPPIVKKSICKRCAYYEFCYS